MKIWQWHCIALTMLLLTSCSALDVMKSAMSAGEPSGISVDAQIGDRENDVQLTGTKVIEGSLTASDDSTVIVDTSTHETASQIETAGVVNIEQIPTSVLLLLILGWLLPTPTTMYRGIKAWLVRIRQPASRRASKQKSR